VVSASLVIVTGSVSAFVVLSHGSHVVMTPATTPLTAGPIPTTLTTLTTLTTSPGSPSPSACANSTIPPTPGAGNGTNLIFTFSGAAPSPMCVVRNDGCKIASSTPDDLYFFDVLGTVNGTLYTFVLATAAYKGPGTYTSVWTVTLDLGDTTSTGPGNGWSAPFTGTVTVNSDGMSGSVDALMNNNKNTSGTVQVTGNWTCSVGLGLPHYDR
jgi:hypothetical protein